MSTHPELPAKYLAPLINLGGLPPEVELRHRLELGIDETEKADEWLARVVDAPHGAVAEARERDSRLVAEFKREGRTKFERVRRLELLENIAPIFAVEDLDWAPSFLVECKREFGDRVRTFRFSRRLDNTYPKAWAKYAALETRPTVLANLEDYFRAIDGPFERECFIRELADLPLEEWVGLHDDAATRLTELALAFGQEAAHDEERTSEEALGWTLHAVIEATRRYGRTLPDALLNGAHAWSERILSTSGATNASDGFTVNDAAGAISAAVHVAWLFAPDEAARGGIVGHALARAREAPRRALGIWTSLVEAGATPTSDAMANAATEFWGMLDAEWEATCRFTARNPHLARPLVRFLVEVIASGALGSVQLGRERLRGVLGSAPRGLPLCAKILDPRYWDADWPAFLEVAWRSACGGDRGGPANAVSHKIAAVDLLQDWLSILGPEEGLRHDVAFLADATFMALLDGSPVVANRAAYTVVAYAGHRCGARDTRRVVSALSRIAADPRLGVRGAAARGARTLQAAGVSEEVRNVAADIEKTLSREEYALIQRQLRFGELEAER